MLGEVLGEFLRALRGEDRGRAGKDLQGDELIVDALKGWKIADEGTSSYSDWTGPSWRTSGTLRAGRGLFGATGGFIRTFAGFTGDGSGAFVKRGGISDAAMAFADGVLLRAMSVQCTFNSKMCG